MESADLLDECPEVSRIALASARGNRDLWLAALALDGRIGRMVLGASEPMLGQMRLAWWRDQLGKPTAERPRGDLLLDVIGQSWEGGEHALLALVNGWEALLSSRPLVEPDAEQFVEGRGQLSLELARRAGYPNAAAQAERAGRLWALADLASHAQFDVERTNAIAFSEELAAERVSLPRELRPMAVLGGLARRSLRSGGRAMLGDRFSPMIALRLGLLGI